MNLASLQEEFGFTDAQLELVQDANTNQTAAISQSKVIANLVLLKGIEESAKAVLSLKEQIPLTGLDLRKSMESEVNRMIESNEALAKAEDRHARWMRALTIALVLTTLVVGLLQVVAIST